MKTGVENQGQSELATEAKQRGLSYALKLSLVVIRKHASWTNPHLHIDLNAGNGDNEKFGCPGTPVTAMQMFREERHFRGIFIDRDEEQIRVLGTRAIMQDQRCQLHCGDNAEFLRSMPKNNGFQLGTVLSDPNGGGHPLAALAEFFYYHRQMDLILHWNSTITKRLKYGLKPDYVVLSDIPKIITTKRHWIIRKPVGIHQFAMLIGRNYRGNDWPKEGFCHLDSDRGQAIMERCSISSKERAAKMEPELELGEIA